jgi:ribose transport system substrate-binding protein
VEFARSRGERTSQVLKSLSHQAINEREGRRPMFWTSPNGHRFGGYRVAAVIAALPLVMVGCSSSGGSHSAQSSAASAGSASASSCVAKASAKLAKDEAPLNQQMPTAPVSAATFKGKTVWDIEYLAASPTVAAISASFQQAGKAIGVNTQLYDGKGTPSGYNDGINQAVAARAAAIMLDGIDPALVTGALANAASKHIPVVDLFGSAMPTAPYPQGLISHLTFDPAALGASQADYALAKSGCKGGFVYSAVQGLAVEDGVLGGAKDEIAALCGSSCSFYSTETEATVLATKLSGQVEALAQEHSEIGYVMVGADSMVQYAENGLTTVGKTNVGIVGISGTNLPNMRNGQLPYEVADAVYTPGAVMGWFGMYVALQAANGGQRNNLVLAYHTVDASNLQTLVQVPNFMTTFLKLFGVSS